MDNDNTQKQMAAAIAASAIWRAASAFPRQLAGWPAGPEEDAAEAILRAADAAGRCRHDPRRMVADDAAWEARRLAEVQASLAAMAAQNAAYAADPEAAISAAIAAGAAKQAVYAAARAAAKRTGRR